MDKNFPEKILKLKKEMNAIILAHYYQNSDIQDIADFIGDSLDLSRKAANNDAEFIIFAGVKFMAEVAKILSPQKRVLVPDMNAGCSLEEACQPKDFAKMRKKYPDHIFITYINCSAEIKALSDIIVTSTNAEKIVLQIPRDKEIVFAPDKHLGAYIAKKTGREMVLWDGACIIHENFSEKELLELKNKHKNAFIIAHPECSSSLLKYADFVGSTSALLKFTKDNPSSEFIVLTEPGIIHQMQKISDGSIFYECRSLNESGCSFCSQCPHMKLNNLEKLYLCMEEQKNEIFLSDDLIIKARKPLELMLKMS